MSTVMQSHDVFSQDHYQNKVVQTFLQEPFPCESCDIANTCRVNKICCEDFHRYTLTGITNATNRVPSKRWMRINSSEDKKIGEQDRMEAMSIAVHHGLDMATAATGIKPYRIKQWLIEATNNRRKVNA